MTTFAAILPTYETTDLTSRLRGYLIAAKCPVTDWNSGGFVRTLMEQWRGAIADYVGVADDNGPKTRYQVVAGPVPMLPDVASQSASDWLTLVE